jgi:hypothetical protein
VLIGAAVVVASLAATPLVSGASHAAPAAARATVQRADPMCPAHPLPLGPAGVAGAAEAALAQARAVYGPGKDLTDMRVISAARAPYAGGRGDYARVKCSVRTERRTVVVRLDFPAERGASLREGIVLVSRLRGGFDVWTLLH